MWSGEKTAARRELPLCLAVLLLPPEPAASLTTSWPLEKHKQSPLWGEKKKNAQTLYSRWRGQEAA